MINGNKVPSKGGNFERPPALENGTYPARLVQVVGVGLQEQEPYQGVEKDPAYELILTYELVDEFLLDEDGNDIEDKPRWVGETIPLHSLDADLAKSTKRYYALDPNGEAEGDWSKLVGKPCMIQLVKKTSKRTGRDYNNVTGLSAVREKDAKKMPTLVNPSLVFDCDDPDFDVWEKLPDWIKKKIQAGLEYEEGPIFAHTEATDNSATPVADTPKKATQRRSQKVSEATEADVEDNVDEDEEEW